MTTDSLDYELWRAVAAFENVPTSLVRMSSSLDGIQIRLDKRLVDDLRALLAEVDRLREREDTLRAAAEASTEALGLVGDQLQRLAGLGALQIRSVGDPVNDFRYSPTWELTLELVTGDNVRVRRPTIVDLMRAAGAIVAATRDSLPIVAAEG